MSVFARLVLKSGASLHRLKSFSSLSSLPQISDDAVQGNNSLLINNGTEIFSTTISPRDGALVETERKNLSFPIQGEGEEGPLFVVGPCNGQYCIYSGWKSVSLFNPATGDITNYTLPLWKRFFSADVHSLGFGYDSKINKFKIVRSITLDLWNHQCNPVDLSYQGRKAHSIEVIRLSSYKHRREIPVLGEIRARIPSLCGVPNVDGVCYWSCKDYHYKKAKVMSFNFADEMFHVFTLPPCDYLNYNPETEECLMEVFNGSPAAIRYDASPDKYFEVWVKRETWIKEMCIGPIFDVIKPLCFWNNGEGLLLLDSEYQLVSYDFYTKQAKKLNIQLPEPIKSEGRKMPIIQVLNLPQMT